MKKAKLSVILLAILLCYSLSVAFAFQYFFTTEKQQINAGLIITKHDVAVTSVKLYKNIVAQGYNVRVNVTLANRGNYTETFRVTTYANTTIINQNEVTLTHENSIVITFTWNTYGFATGNYTIKAILDIVPGETDTDDNTLSDGWIIVAMVGDISGPGGFPDGQCNMMDVGAIARAFGSYLGHPRWNPNYDINDDNKINMLDIGTVARQFGETDP